MTRYPADTLVGLLSDSHGRYERTRQAVARLEEAGAGVFVHLGDFEDERVLDALAGLRAHVVFGNCDLWQVGPLTEYARSIGVNVDHPAGRIEVGERGLAFLHGHDGRAMREALAARPAYLAHGHSHERRDERVGGTRIVNPGALQRAAEYTVALLDAMNDRVEFLTVPKE